MSLIHPCTAMTWTHLHLFRMLVSQFDSISYTAETTFCNLNDLEAAHNDRPRRYSQSIIPPPDPSKNNSYCHLPESTKLPSIETIPSSSMKGTYFSPSALTASNAFSEAFAANPLRSSRPSQPAVKGYNVDEQPTEFMCDYSTSSFHSRDSLVDFGVWCVLRVCDEDCLLRLHCIGDCDEKRHQEGD